MKTIPIFLLTLLISFSTTAEDLLIENYTSKQIVKRAYQTFASGDTEAWAELHTKDLKFSIFGQLPHSGVHIGTDATIKNVFEVLPLHWPNFKLKIVNMDAIEGELGSTVYVLNKMTADGLDSYALHMFTLKNSKIATFSAFDDYDSMRQAMIK